MRKVYLHGHLAQFGECHEWNVATAGEALRALIANFPLFKTALEKGFYEVVVGDAKDGHALDKEDLNEFRLGRGDLHFIPVAEGHKRGGLLKAILGVVLIGVAAFMGFGTMALPGMLGGVTWGNVAMVGLGLAVAGASQLLTKQDKKDEDKEDNSYSLSGSLNAYEQGSAIPLVYGEVITGGSVISAGINIEQLKKGG